LQTAVKKSVKKSSYSNKHLLFIQIAELKSILWKTINFYALAEINNYTKIPLNEVWGRDDRKVFSKVVEQ